MKKFDCEDEPNEFMEMPCQCDCGKWFDLNDGYRSIFSEKVICKGCYKNEGDDIGDKILKAVGKVIDENEPECTCDELAKQRTYCPVHDKEQIDNNKKLSQQLKSKKINS